MLGEKIKKARTIAKMTQEELAKKVGRSRVTVGRWESGQREPFAGEVLAIANALNTSVTYLMGETEDPTRPTSLPEPDGKKDEELPSNPLSLEAITQKHQVLARLNSGLSFEKEQKFTTLENILRAREGMRNLQLLDEHDLNAATEMVCAMLETVQRERALRTAQQDGIAKSA